MWQADGRLIKKKKKYENLSGNEHVISHDDDGYRPSEKNISTVDESARLNHSLETDGQLSLLEEL